jgi:hypothetical protein
MMMLRRSVEGLAGLASCAHRPFACQGMAQTHHGQEAVGHWPGTLCQPRRTIASATASRGRSGVSGSKYRLVCRLLR